MTTLRLSLVRAFVLACLAVVLSASVHAQTINLDNTTAPPTTGVGHDYIKSLNETVNPANGSLSVRIELPLPDGRGLRIPFALTYSSSTVQRVYGKSNGGGQWFNNSLSSSGGWSNSIPSFTAVQGSNSFYNPDPPTTYACAFISNYNFTDWSGATHPLNLSIVQDQTSDITNCNSWPPIFPSPSLSGGDNFYQAITTPTCTDCVPNLPTPVQVVDADGTVYNFSQAQDTDGTFDQYVSPQDSSFAQKYNTGYWGYVSSIEDRNGNILTVNLGSCGFWYCPSITDDAGRQLVSTNASGTAITLLGQTSSYLEAWERTPVNFSVNSTPVGSNPSLCAGIDPDTASNVVVQTLTLPNTQQYKFYYDSKYGLLNEIVYPDGGSVSYTWGVNAQSEIIALPQIPNSQNNTGFCFAVYDLPAITQRTVSYGGNAVETQTFSYTTDSAISTKYQWTTKTTTVTTNDLVRGTSFQNVYTYTPVFAASAPNTNGSGQIATEQSIAYHDFTGNLLKTVYKSFGGINGTLLTCELDQLDNGLISGTWYTYGSGGEITDEKEYDYGVITSPSACPGSGAPSNPTRETVTAYQSFSPTKIFPSRASIFDRPSSVKIYNGSSSGTLVAETDSAYDGVAVTSPGTVTGHDDTNYSASNNNRGNLTTKTVKCLQSCTDSVTTYTYDTTGQVLSKKDPCGNGTCAEMTGSTHKTTYSYTDAYTVLNGGSNSSYTPTPATQTNAYLTKITDNLGHISSFTYDYDSGELTSVTDPNLQVTKYVYNDFFWRPTSVIDPDNPSSAAITYAYNDSPYNATAGTPSVTVTKAVTASTSVVTKTSFDGMHHPLVTTMSSDPDGPTSTVMTYDGVGKPYTSTNPYRATSDSTYGTTTHVYDALGRTVAVNEPDGSSVATSYSGNCSTVADEAGHLRQSCSDGFGRLIEVDEPGSGQTSPTKGSVTISINYNASLAVNTYQFCPPPGGNCQQITNYNQGMIYLTVNGVQFSTQYGPPPPTAPYTVQYVASALASSINGSSSLVTAVANGNGTITLTASTTGLETDYSFSTSATYNSGALCPTNPCFSGPSFYASPTSGELAGGSDGGLVPPGFVTKYAYDVLNNMTCAVQKGTDTTNTTCALAPATWRPRLFAYDSLSRLISSTNPEVNTAALPGTLTPTLYSYDLNGNLMSKTFLAPNQQNTSTSTISYCYDDDNRLTKKSYSASTSCASPVATYTYDQTSCLGASSCSNIGHRTSMTDAAGSENWSYDTMGRVLKEKRTTNSLAKTTTYAYAPYLDGSISSITYPSGRVVNYTVGAAGRPLTAADSSVSYASAVHYAPQGAPSAIGYGASGAAIAYTEIYNNRLQPCWLYGTSGTALATTHLCADTATTGNFLDLKYNFSPGTDNGNVIGITNNRDTTRSMVFAYDLLNRLQSANTTSTHATSAANCWGELYGLDAWGNLSSLTNLNSQYTGCTEEPPFTATASVQNQLPLSSNKYDSAGNLINGLANGVTYAYTYDTENELQSVTGLTTTTNYIYDGDGRRVEKTGGTAKLYWYGAGGDVLDETDATGSFTNTGFSEYIYFGGHRIARRDSAGNVYYYLADHLGTSRVMGEVASGQSTATLCYDADFYPYGGERAVVNLCGQNYKFTGKERDTESGLDDFGARYYASSWGRFMTPDWAERPTDVPYANFGNPQSLNLYSYVKNNPSTFGDPDGHCPDACVGEAIAGFAILAIATQAYYATPPSQRDFGGSLHQAGVSIGNWIRGWSQKSGNDKTAPAPQSNPAPTNGGNIQPYDVGKANDLQGRSVSGDNIDVHHVPQQNPASQTVPGYDGKTAPAIGLPRDEHKGIPTERGAATRTPRDQLAKDAKDLRNHTNASNPQVQKVIDLNKQTFPDMNKPPKKLPDPPQ